MARSMVTWRQSSSAAITSALNPSGSLCPR